MQYSINMIKATKIFVNTSIRGSYRQFSKKKVVILGSGWGGFRLAQDLNKDLFDVYVVSPRNHFLFTPLLPSTAVGTLEFRCIQEPVRTIPGVKYVQASCTDINFESNTMSCLEIFKKRSYEESFDYLVLAVGSETNTFGVKGVFDNPNVFFLKQLDHARSIRQKLIECFERASTPDLSEYERKRLLTFVVVGGGPTNVEFASELHDFLNEDVTKWYPDLRKNIKVVMVEASNHILGAFNSSLVEYVEKLFSSRNIVVMTETAVKEIKGSTAMLGNGMELPFGVLVWSTGVKQVDLIQNLSKDISRACGGRLHVDSHMRVLSVDKATDYSTASVKPSDIPLSEGRVFAMGDCACDSNKPLPALAQVASQQAQYIATLLNKHLDEVTTSTPASQLIAPHFTYAHLGSMASVGQWKGVYDSTNIDPSDRAVATPPTPPIKGFLAFALWRAAYWTKQVSIINKMLIPMYWFKSAVFGRDISRF